MATTTETRTEKGISLARGPALILGTILLAAGLYFIYRQHEFPKFSNFPNGTPVVSGKVFGIFRANGWTGMLTAVAGGLLLFGAAQHLLAKTMSLIVGVALGAAAVIGLISGNVLGMAASNGWTELGWGIAAAILLLNSLIPRRTRTVEAYDRPAARPSRARTGAVGAGAAAGTGAAGGAAIGARERPIRDREGAAGAREGGSARPVDPEAGTAAPDDRTALRRDEGTVAADREGVDEPAVGRGGVDEPAVGRGGVDEPLDAPERRVRSGEDPD